MLTLIVNAPIIPSLVGRLGLLDVPHVKRRMRAKAARALLRFSTHAVHDLQQDPDEMLRGTATPLPVPVAPSSTCGARLYCSVYGTTDLADLCCGPLSGSLS